MGHSVFVVSLNERFDDLHHFGVVGENCFQLRFCLFQPPFIMFASSFVKSLWLSTCRKVTWDSASTTAGRSWSGCWSWRSRGVGPDNQPSAIRKQEIITGREKKEKVH